MQSTVSCDRVFDALTEQPFPSGSEDDSRIEEHLRACHDCRRLAEALRPAVDLLHESLQHASLDQAHAVNRIGTAYDAAQSALPSFAGFSDEGAAVDAIMSHVRAASLSPENSSAELPPHGDETTKPRASLWSPGSLAAFAVIAATVMLMFALSQDAANGDDETFADDSDRYAYLAGCGVPTACLSNVGWTTLTDQTCDFADATKNEDRCMQCHNAVLSDTTNCNSPHWIQSENETLLTKSCRDCHTANPHASDSATDKACCTKCHNATATEPPKSHSPHHMGPESVTLLAKSCRACHTSNP